MDKVKHYVLKIPALSVLAFWLLAFFISSIYNFLTNFQNLNPCVIFVFLAFLQGQFYVGRFCESYPKEKRLYFAGFGILVCFIYSLISPSFFYYISRDFLFGVLFIVRMVVYYALIYLFLDFGSLRGEKLLSAKSLKSSMGQDHSHQD